MPHPRLLKRENTLILVSAVFAVALAGCSSSSVGPLPETVTADESSANQPFQSSADTDDTAAAVTEANDANAIGTNTASTLAGINSVATDLGLILRASEDNRTLYTSDDDPNGLSTCTASCALTWQPLLANDQQQEELAGEQAVAEPFSLLAGLSIITRPEGTSQWAFNGAPLYQFIDDLAAGDVNGQGVDDIWYVARPFAWQIRLDESGAEFFAGQGSVNTGIDVADFRNTDLDGLSLYTFAQDTFGLSDCNGICADQRPPLFADRGARAFGGFSVITRNNGTAQWAFNGMPLYFFIDDANPGDTLGDGFGGVWFLARP